MATECWKIYDQHPAVNVWQNSFLVFLCGVVFVTTLIFLFPRNQTVIESCFVAIRVHHNTMMLGLGISIESLGKLIAFFR